MSVDRITRRRFVTTTIAATATIAAVPVLGKEQHLKIDRIDLFPFRYPMTGFFKFLSRRRGATGRAAVIVKITASDGTVGWGQSVPVETWSYETLEAATVALRDYYAPALIGHDPTDIVGAHKIMDHVIRPGFSTGMPLTRAGVDIALHDLTGKLLGKSLCQLWNRPRGGPITLSWTVNARSIDEVAAIMDEGSRRGYQHFNIKVAPNPAFDIELARTVRKLAPNGFLWADANAGYDTKTALEIAPKFADIGVDVLEAPIKPNEISGYQALKRQGALPILMDEGIVSPIELREFIRLKMLDGVAMKPSRCGGLMSNKQQIELVRQHDLMWLGSGLTDPDISLAASLALFGAYGLQKPAALNGPQFLTADVLVTPLKVENGTIAVPTGPGLGVEVDEEKIAELMGK